MRYLSAHMQWVGMGQIAKHFKRSPSAVRLWPKYADFPDPVFESGGRKYYDLQAVAIWFRTCLPKQGRPKKNESTDLDV